MDMFTTVQGEHLGRPLAHPYAELVAGTRTRGDP